MSPEDPIIREYISCDAQAIVRLHAQSDHCFEEGDITEEFIDYIANRDDFRFYVAEVGGNVIGFCGVLYYPSVGRAEIGPIAVERDSRRASVGRALYSAAERFLLDKKVRRVTAKIKAQNAGAIAFFTGLGFVLEGCFREYTAKKEDVYQYVKFI